MNNSKTSEIINNIIKFILIFALIFLWLRYLKIDNLYAFIIAIVVDIALCKLFEFISKNRQVSKQIEKNEKKDIDKYMLSFLLSDKLDNIDFFHKAIKNSKIIDEFVVYNNVALSPIFDSDTINWEHIAKSVIKAKKMGYKSIIICCVESKIKKFDIDGINVKILEKEQTYLKILKANDCYPKIVLDIKPKRTLKGVLSQFIDKKRAKHYFYFAIISFLCSTFVYFKLYYLIIGTIFSVLSLLCFLNKKQIVVEENIWQ